MNCISDLFIFLLPLPMVWQLHLSRKAKLGVTVVFMGGAMQVIKCSHWEEWTLTLRRAFIVAVVRFGLLLHRFHVTDTTWYDGKNLIWM